MRCDGVRRLALCLLALCPAALCPVALCPVAGAAHAQAAPAFSDTGPDAAAYGTALGYPVGSRGQVNSQPAMVGSTSHFDAIFPTHLVARAADPAPLRRAA